MIAGNKGIANLYDIEYETDYFVNSYDYKFVTFIRVITIVCLQANLKMKIHTKLFLNYTNFMAYSSRSNSVKERFLYVTI